ncbi:hypothetical protein [Oceanisphaera psychrotolerans]|uniref:Uncharacterized protein n=1 Tax=Oceanisphaera psychrotolerans TaxID=1414654 RepID=A0A1J4QH82_9GAMM|nr:hypothetical protein [Oceanisphaera psychrotolerans]OIN14301.1 hypothetical protein BFR47_08415 [Oceanisphaera psychrotolerans]
MDVLLLEDDLLTAELIQTVLQGSTPGVRILLTFNVAEAGLPGPNNRFNWFSVTGICRTAADWS